MEVCLGTDQHMVQWPSARPLDAQLLPMPMRKRSSQCSAAPASQCKPSVYTTLEDLDLRTAASNRAGGRCLQGARA